MDSRPRDAKGRIMHNWVVSRPDGSSRVIRHIDPARPEPETPLFVPADWLEAKWARLRNWFVLVVGGVV